MSRRAFRTAGDGALARGRYWGLLLLLVLAGRTSATPIASSDPHAPPAGIPTSLRNADGAGAAALGTAPLPSLPSGLGGTELLDLTPPKALAGDGAAAASQDTPRLPAATATARARPRSSQTLTELLHRYVNVRADSGSASTSPSSVDDGPALGTERYTPDTGDAALPLDIREMLAALITAVARPHTDAQGRRHFSLLGFGDFVIDVSRGGSVLGVFERHAGALYSNASGFTGPVTPGPDDMTLATSRPPGPPLTLQAFLDFILAKALSSPFFYLLVAILMMWGVVRLVLRLQDLQHVRTARIGAVAAAFRGTPRRVHRRSRGHRRRTSRRR